MKNLTPNTQHLTPKIVFIGTPEFGAIILERLAKTEYKPILVITMPDNPAGRKQILTPPPVKTTSEKYGIPLLQPASIKSRISEIRNLEPDLIIVAAYGKIIPKGILDIPKHGCLNVHPSLLPEYRGPSPIQAAILNGDKETGVTIILLDEKMDHGAIISNFQLPISNDATAENLSKRLAKTGAELLIETIPKWISGEIKPQPQDESKATFTKIIKKEDGRIDWTKPALEIERQIRAFYPWPGSFTFIEKNSKKLMLKVIEAIIVPGKNLKGGETFIFEKSLGVKCGKDALAIKTIQLEGRKPMTSEEFLRGNKNLIGQILK